MQVFATSPVLVGTQMLDLYAGKTVLLDLMIAEPSVLPINQNVLEKLLVLQRTLLKLQLVLLQQRLVMKSRLQILWRGLKEL